MKAKVTKKVTAKTSKAVNKNVKAAKVDTTEVEQIETKDILIAGKYPAKEVIRPKQKETVSNNMLTIEELRAVMKPHSNKVSNLPRCLSL